MGDGKRIKQACYSSLTSVYSGCFQKHKDIYAENKQGILVSPQAFPPPLQSPFHLSYEF